MAQTNLFKFGMKGSAPQAAAAAHWQPRPLRPRCPVPQAAAPDAAGQAPNAAAPAPGAAAEVPPLAAAEAAVALVAQRQPGLQQRDCVSF